MFRHLRHALIPCLSMLNGKGAMRRNNLRHLCALSGPFRAAGGLGPMRRNSLRHLRTLILCLSMGSAAADQASAPAHAEDAALSFNFQDVEVRSALQTVADFTGLNLVAGDTVSGRITLRLEDVPWRQALDLILQAKGLGQRQVGDVLLIAPEAEIAAAEQQRLENERKMEALAPLHTEHIQIGYARAADLWALFDGIGAQEGGAAEQGSALIDERTNAIIVTGTEAQIQAFRRIVAALDVPVRQVLIESRIISVNSNYSQRFGVRWGGGGIVEGDERSVRIGGSLKTLGELQNAVADPTKAGTISSPDDLVVDLGVLNEGASSIGVGLTGDSYLIDLEISALEAEGNAEVMARPKVIMADKSRARIESGVEIPYQEASSSGATSTSFKDAVLALEVMPRITPDDRIIMEINVKHDNVGKIFNGIPSINTNEIQTEVLVNDGQTVVLGGIFQTDRNLATEKTPLLGDLPLLGRLFRRTYERDDKQELLIFITPRILPTGADAGQEGEDA